jgi:hypothetical protein
MDCKQCKDEPLFINCITSHKFDDWMKDVCMDKIFGWDDNLIVWTSSRMSVLRVQNKKEKREKGERKKSYKH